MDSRFEEVLRGSAIMRFVPAEHYTRLRDSFTTEHFEFGELIVRQGDAADAFYILVNGRATPPPRPSRRSSRRRRAR